MEKKRIGLLFIVFMLLISFATGALAAEKPRADKDIVDTAVDAGDFSILAGALEKANLVEALKGEGPFTVFAPTDQAFKQLLAELGITIDELLAREDLATILQYHVVPGKMMSGDLKDGMKVKTLAEKEVMISLDPVRINDAKVAKPDIEASNGVIHVIDKVLLPN
ncbi:fasciclin domain-containing protein [Halalkalibacter krulwichiae]|uniref:Immunogenic protein MPT70 n=1 Tax=Halalkalibacter krulwichiae TaxID=199441 RepID=A0A1X9MLC9_9BACI|nr:fasciclin domain-containing protein [Halalkalibacter krulwichiae]ARK31612.1 Immunogenic protein MPT70 precursor [Halalkalibacter krulwichiae]